MNSMDLVRSKLIPIDVNGEHGLVLESILNLFPTYRDQFLAFTGGDTIPDSFPNNIDGCTLDDFQKFIETVVYLEILEAHGYEHSEPIDSFNREKDVECYLFADYLQYDKYIQKYYQISPMEVKPEIMKLLDLRSDYHTVIDRRIGGGFRDFMSERTKQLPYYYKIAPHSFKKTQVYDEMRRYFVTKVDKMATKNIDYNFYIDDLLDLLLAASQYEEIYTVIRSKAVAIILKWYRKCNFGYGVTSNEILFDKYRGKIINNIEFPELDVLMSKCYHLNQVLNETDMFVVHAEQVISYQTVTVSYAVCNGECWFVDELLEEARDLNIPDDPVPSSVKPEQLDTYRQYIKCLNVLYTKFGRTSDNTRNKYLFGTYKDESEGVVKHTENNKWSCSVLRNQTYYDTSTQYLKYMEIRTLNVRVRFCGDTYRYQPLDYLSLPEEVRTGQYEYVVVSTPQGLVAFNSDCDVVELTESLRESFERLAQIPIDRDKCIKLVDPKVHKVWSKSS